MTDRRIYTNTERFIYEVSIRSCLWNVHCIEYKDKNKRRKAWEDICKIFFSDFKSRNNDKKEHLCRLIQKKWKSIRDTYVRNIRRNRPVRYGHASSLSFLRDCIKLYKPIDPTIEDNNSDYNPDLEADEEEAIENEEYDEEELIFKSRTVLFPHDANQSSNSNNSIHLEVQTIAEPNIPLPTEQITSPSNSVTAGQEDDDDRLFLLSLLKDLKKIPEYNKLEAKSELLLVLNKWKKSNLEVWCPDAI